MILIAGGSGTLGRLLVPMLQARGRRSRILSRHGFTQPHDPLTNGAIEVAMGDVRDPAALDAALDGVDTIVSAITGFGGADALGTKAVDRDGNLALFDAARRARVGRVVLVSVNRAGPDHPIELFRDKWAAEEGLRNSGLDWTIVRPTAYLETWLAIVGGPLVATGKTRIFGRGRNPINFVSALDVARYVDLAIADPALQLAEVEVPGPENLTLDDLASVIEGTIGRTGQRQHLPPFLMRIASGLVRLRNPVLAAQIRTALVMDTQDMTVDGPALRRNHPSIPMTSAKQVADRLFGG